ncbi:Rqc2 family fibronectin-binding protein [Saliterribacillus persicus]|uniref:Rqc2 homolog RqcH n=1 Tax=Saliterribacillus persicus TaxID=930114 RepID=A0A368XS18_9BACI|nr:NFACT RNA binding domain-containing protein [Saliterribacillus persicus]RCW70771.1 putative ribosome quality control (RQC) complex YloA/Tae2 family protein [Saliterribacillus persicus]
MAFDGLLTRAIVEELSTTLSSARIIKIYQPTELELVLSIRRQGKNHTLLLSAHPNYARIHLTKDQYQNPKEPSMFCMLLRKHISGSFIESIEQIENERIIHIHIKSTNEIGDTTYKTIAIEIMGKHSNIILIDKERKMILDSIKHISLSQSRMRPVLPGQLYQLPPDQEKVNPLTVDGENFLKKIDFNAGKIDRQMLQAFMGFSPLIAREIVYHAQLGNSESYKDAFLELKEKMLLHQYSPVIYEENSIYYITELSHVKENGKQYESVNEMLDQFFSGKAERDRVKQKAGDLFRLLKNELNKNERKIVKLKKTLKDADKASNFQKKGELLTANMHLVKLGDKSVTVTDYYDEDQKELEIKLNERKTPSENAQSFFKKYQKLKNSKVMVENELKKTAKEVNYLNELVQQMDDAREQDIEEIREELQDQGYIKKKFTKAKKNKKVHKPEPEKFYASDGTLLLVGKNNRQNEYVTNRLGHKSDIWLHTKDIPGSHVVIKSNDPSEETLIEAANLAAFYSKSKNSSTVPVDYTQIKHVKKPSGAKPGFVTYDNQKTIFVTPDKNLIKKLKEEPS